jgi:hypothetical protein
MPLPPHLPNTRKDLLILMAAYYGDINAYSRLRRPTLLPYEDNFIVRGIYHNTMFAKWWSLQPLPGGKGSLVSDGIEAAILARFIMNNDLSRINTDTRNMPELIYYPGLAKEGTYKELFRRQPSMKEPIARACIIGDYQELYDSLGVEPDEGLLREARDSPNKHYLMDLERKLSEGATLPDTCCKPYWKCLTRRTMFERRSSDLRYYFYDSSLCQNFDFIYNDLDANTGALELFISVSDEVKKSIKYSYGWAQIEQSYGQDPHDDDKTGK